MPGSAGMAIPGVLITQSSKGIACFGHALYMKGVLSVLANKGLLGLARVLKHDGHFRLLYKWGLGS